MPLTKISSANDLLTQNADEKPFWQNENLAELIGKEVVKSKKCEKIWVVQAKPLFEQQGMICFRVNIWTRHSSNTLIPQLSISESYFVIYDSKTKQVKEIR